MVFNKQLNRDSETNNKQKYRGDICYFLLRRRKKERTFHLNLKIFI